MTVPAKALRSLEAAVGPSLRCPSTPSSLTSTPKVTLTHNPLFAPAGSPEILTFKDLPSAQQHVATFWQMEKYNKAALNNIANSAYANDPSAWTGYFYYFNQGLQLLQPGPTETKVVTVNSPTNTQNNTQTSVQQDITSTGNSTTQTPLPQSVCNMMINGQCNPNTVTAVTAVVGVAVIGGITAAVVSAVNNQAQQQQEQQKSKDLWNVLIINQSKKGSSCQCSDPVGANFCGFNVCGP